MADHKYDAQTYKCLNCGAGIYTTNMGECPGRTPDQAEKEAKLTWIWKAIRDCGS